MKIPLVLLSALCAFPICGHAQIQRQTIPSGESRTFTFLTPHVPGVNLRGVRSANGSTLLVQVSGVSVGRALERIAAVTGTPVLVSPALKARAPQNFEARGANVNELIANICGMFGLQRAQTDSGVTRISERKAPAPPLGDYGLNLRPEKNAPPELPHLTQNAQARQSSRQNYRFVVPGGVAPAQPKIDPDFNLRAPTGPQPHWDKREFNGRDYYHIPLPAN